MKNYVLIILALIIFSSCGNSSGNITHEDNSKTGNIVEVLYFHGKQRCTTCNAIESLTKEVIEQEYEQQLREGKIQFKCIDISTKEGERIADKYEVTWSSLFINKWTDGKESLNNMTDTGFTYAKGSPDVFKTEVKKQIDKLLK